MANDAVCLARACPSGECATAHDVPVLVTLLREECEELDRYRDGSLKTWGELVEYDR